MKTDEWAGVGDGMEVQSYFRSFRVNTTLEKTETNINSGKGVQSFRFAGESRRCC
jgi:hypothetical protein